MISFKGRHHQQDIILQCMRWYVAYSLNYSDLEELMQERGYVVDHSTIQRWVVHYAPRIEKAFRKNKKRTGMRWRMNWSSIPITGLLSGEPGLCLASPEAPTVGKSFWSARAILAGIELWHILKKGQNKSSLLAWERFYALALTG